MKKRTVLLFTAVITIFGMSCIVPDPEAENGTEFRPPVSLPKTPQWIWESPKPIGNGILGLCSTLNEKGEVELIAVGKNGVVAERKNNKWTVPSTPSLSQDNLFPTTTELSFRSVAVNGKKTAIAIGDNDLGVMVRSKNQWLQFSIPTRGKMLNSIWANPNKDQFFSVGNEGEIYEITEEGTLWKGPPPITSETLTSVYGIGIANNFELYAVGKMGTILHRDFLGQYTQIAPTIIPGFANEDFYGVWISDFPKPITYIVGDRGKVFSFENGIWKQEILPITHNGVPTNTIRLYAIDGVGQNIVVSGTNGAIFQKIEGTWKAVGEKITTNDLRSITHQTIDGKTLFYLAGENSELILGNIHGWQRFDEPATNENLKGIYSDGGTETYAIGENGTILKRTISGNWEQEKEMSELPPIKINLNDIAGFKNNIYIVGDFGTILRRTKDKWILEGRVLTYQNLNRVYVGENIAYAIGDNGTILEKKPGHEWKIFEALRFGKISGDLSSVWVNPKDPSSLFVATKEGSFITILNYLWVEEAFLGAPVMALVGNNEYNLFAISDKFIVNRKKDNWSNYDFPRLPWVTYVLEDAQLIPGTDDFVLVGNPGVVGTTQNRGKYYHITDKPLNRIHIVSKDDMYIVGDGGLIVHYN